MVSLSIFGDLLERNIGYRWEFEVGQDILRFVWGGRWHGRYLETKGRGKVTVYKSNVLLMK